MIYIAMKLRSKKVNLSLFLEKIQHNKISTYFQPNNYT